MVVRLKDLTAKDAEKMTCLPYSAARARAEYPESLLKSILRPLRALALRSLRFFAFWSCLSQTLVLSCMSDKKHTRKSKYYHVLEYC